MAGRGESEDENASPTKLQLLRDVMKVADKKSKILTPIEYDRLGEYTSEEVLDHFDDWTAVMKQLHNREKRTHGDEYICECGSVLHSKSEKKVGDLLHEYNIDHEVHTKIPGINRRTDFYLPEWDLWIEVDGYGNSDRPNMDRYVQKIHHYEHSDLNYVEIEEPLRQSEESIKQTINEAVRG